MPLEYEFRKQNEDRMAESEKMYQTLDECLVYYEEKLQELLDSNQSLTEQQFSDIEDTIKTNARKLFRQKCSVESIFFSKFDNCFRERISQLKYDFKEQFKRKREKIIVDIEIDLIDKLEELNKLFQSCSRREFEQGVLRIKDSFIEELKNRSLSEEQNKSFIQKLESKITQLLNSFVENSKNIQESSETLALESIFDKSCKVSLLGEV